VQQQTAGVCWSLQLFDPTSIGNTFTNGGGGAYTLTIEPVPLPSMTSASLFAVSSLGAKTPAQKVTTAQVKASGSTACTI
jgi:hypothetical protein